MAHSVISLTITGKRFWFERRTGTRIITQIMSRPSPIVQAVASFWWMKKKRERKWKLDCRPWRAWWKGNWTWEVSPRNRCYKGHRILTTKTMKRKNRLGCCQRLVILMWTERVCPCTKFSWTHTTISSSSKSLIVEWASTVEWDTIVAWPRLQTKIRMHLVWVRELSVKVRRHL